MAGSKMAMSLGIVLLTMQLMAGGARAQSDCTNVLISLSPCLNYITGNSSTPPQQCCGQLATVVRSSPLCLCQLLNGGGSSFGVNINQTRALELPRACNVQTPPISRCNASSPTAAPEGSTVPGVPTTPGSGSVPSTPGTGSSDGSSIKMSMSLLLLSLIAASYCSAFMR
ncbi:Non-specific lipid transfer protein GPI-anchored 5 [Linum grandiflorum]